jgi:hypothetical protein
MTIRIQSDGAIVFMHDTKQLKAIYALVGGTVRTLRASHVEPICSHGQNKIPRWNVDLSPIHGPSELAETFETREEALKAETRWIQENYLGSASTNSLPFETSKQSHPSSSTIPHR